MARTKQYDVLNEQVVVAAMLQEAGHRRRILGEVSRQDFRGPKHSTMYDAIERCWQRDIDPTPANVVSMAQDDVGGYEYVGKLAGLPLPTDVAGCVRRLKQEAARMKTLKRLEEIKESLSDPSVEYSECVGELDAAASLMRDATTGEADATTTVADRWVEQFDRHCNGAAPFVSTGYGSLDEVLNEGFARGNTSVVAGRTRNGKSMFVVDCVRRQLERERKPRILVMPLEGGPEKFMNLIVASATHIDTDYFLKRPHELTLEQRRKIRHVAKKIVGTDDRLNVVRNVFLELTARGEWTNATALDKMEEMLASGNYDIAFFDLWERCLTDLRPHAITAALVRMQALAQKYRTHCVLVHQMGRDFEKERMKRRGRNRKPTLTDLKNSGAYEEIADLVLFIYREKVYKPHMLQDTIEVIVAKQKLREADVSMVTDFWPAVCRLENDRLVDADDEPEPEFAEDVV